MIFSGVISMLRLLTDEQQKRLSHQEVH